MEVAIVAATRPEVQHISLGQTIATTMNHCWITSMPTLALQSQSLKP